MGTAFNMRPPHASPQHNGSAIRPPPHGGSRLHPTILASEGLGRSTVLVAIGLAGFLLGVLVYWMDRETSRVELIPTVAWLAHRHVFGELGGPLPSFAHTFAFSLFTAAALPVRSAPPYGACLAWFAINVAFEIGQHRLVCVPLAEMLQGDLHGWPLSRPIANYFAQGKFDPRDIVAALLGALAAAAVLSLDRHQLKEGHAH